MIRLAICDDIEQETIRAQNIVLKFNETLDPDLQFSPKCYTDPQVLLDDIGDGMAFDVFLLDMEMGEINGISLAKQLREKGVVSTIIFLSSHTDFPYMQDGYKVRALRYVSKLAMETGLFEALQAAIDDQHKRETKYLTVTHYSNTERIPHDNIIYAQRTGRITELIVAEKNSIQLRMPLKDIFQALGSERFLYIDRSCFVNIDYVLKTASGLIVLKNGDTLSISRKMIPKVKSALNRYWGGVT